MSNAMPFIRERSVIERATRSPASRQVKSETRARARVYEWLY